MSELKNTLAGGGFLSENKFESTHAFFFCSVFYLVLVRSTPPVWGSKKKSTATIFFFPLKLWGLLRIRTEMWERHPANDCWGSYCCGRVECRRRLRITLLLCCCAALYSVRSPAVFLFLQQRRACFIRGGQQLQSDAYVASLFDEII